MVSMWARCRALVFAGALPVLSAVSAAAAYGATVSAPANAEDDNNDPLERFNRAMFAFNETFDAWLLKPVARAYDATLPRPIKLGVANFFSNLATPGIALNDVLQSKFELGARDAGRFAVNSTLGLLGVLDVAQDMGLEPREEDFGQTLAVWGVGEGPYIVWPIIGPRTLRDSVGWAGDLLTNPATYIEDDPTRWWMRALDIVDLRARLLPAEKVLEAAAGEDKYIFVRAAYRQRRLYLIHDGQPPRERFFDDEPGAR